jgi:hypothetical protein
MQCRLTWRARATAGPDRRRAVSLSACTLGESFTIAEHEQLEVAGRATDDARTAHADADLDGQLCATGAGARRVAVSRLGPRPGGGGGGGVTALQPAGNDRKGSSRQRLYNVLLLLRYGRGTVLEEILRIVSALWAWWRVPSPLASCQAEPHMRRPRTAVRTVYGLRDTPRNYDREKKKVERDWHPSVYMHESDRGRSDLT